MNQSCHMNPLSMDPYGQALRAYFQGDIAAQLTIRRDDGHIDHLPVSYFFRDESDFSSIDRCAVDRCTGRVLDVGAGTGVHSLALRRRGLEVVAIDIDPISVDIMQRRGLSDVRQSDVFEFQDRPFDTILLLGHGIGMVETVAGLQRFLEGVRKQLTTSGQVLLDSLDVRKTDDPVHLSYHRANQNAGRYFGETRLQFEFSGATGPTCGWLHVDAETLMTHSENAGLRFEIIREEPAGDYLARLENRAS